MSQNTNSYSFIHLHKFAFWVIPLELKQLGFLDFLKRILIKCKSEKKLYFPKSFLNGSFLETRSV